MPAYSPAEVTLRHAQTIPEFFIELINELLVEHAGGDPITLYQEELVNKLYGTGFTEEDALDNGWFEFEPAYEVCGWSVSYERSREADGQVRARWFFTPKQ